MNDEMKLAIENVVFDTAKCTVKLFYDPTDEKIKQAVLDRLYDMR